MANQEIKRTAEETLTNVFGIYGTTVARDINNESNEWYGGWWRYTTSTGRCNFSLEMISLFNKIYRCKIVNYKRKINQILSLYRANVRKIVMNNKEKWKNLRQSVESNAIQVIKNYWNYPAKRPIKIKDIKEHI